MENIYKIKIRTNPDQRDLYPSERRYSASIVLGLSILFLGLAITSCLMSTLVIRRINRVNHTDHRLIERVDNDLGFKSHTLNIPAVICAGAFMMALGNLMASFSGFFAWKRWYIDNNITWFFLTSCFSSITSSISLMLITLSMMDIDLVLTNNQTPISLGLTTNIFITSLLGVIWSVVATNVAFKGMKNHYPDDLVMTKGRVAVCTERKGNKIAKVLPPDILSHFPTNGKIAKYLNKKDVGSGLPKAESNREYEERVKRFLAGETQNKD